MKRISIIFIFILACFTAYSQQIKPYCNKETGSKLQSCNGTAKKKSSEFPSALKNIINKLNDKGLYSNNIDYIIPCDINTFISAYDNDNKYIYYPKNGNVFDKLEANDVKTLKELLHALAHLKAEDKVEINADKIANVFFNALCKPNGTIELLDNTKYEWKDCERKKILLLDSDGDGISDSEDKCPTIFGTNNGCPSQQNKVLGTDSFQNIVDDDCSNIRALCTCLVSANCNFRVNSAKKENEELYTVELLSIGFVYNIRLRLSYKIEFSTDGKIYYSLQKVIQI